MPEVEAPTKEDERRKAILSSAYDTFAVYGFRRTSMDDIAKAVGISRPGLYQYFSNKNDIFRAMVLQTMAESDGELHSQLAQQLPVIEMLRKLFEINVVNPHRVIEALPNGEEILGLKDSIAPDLFEQWHQRAHQSYHTALKQVEGLPQQTVDDLALMISDAVAGMKARKFNVEEFETHFTSILRIVASSLRRG